MSYGEGDTNFCLTNELGTLQFSEKLSIIEFTIMGSHLNNRYVCIPEKHSLESLKYNNLKIWYLSKIILKILNLTKFIFKGKQLRMSMVDKLPRISV